MGSKGIIYADEPWESFTVATALSPGKASKGPSRCPPSWLSPKHINASERGSSSVLQILEARKPRRGGAEEGSCWPGSCVEWIDRGQSENADEGGAVFHNGILRPILAPTKDLCWLGLPEARIVGGQNWLGFLSQQSLTSEGRPARALRK